MRDIGNACYTNKTKSKSSAPSITTDVLVYSSHSCSLYCAERNFLNVLDSSDTLLITDHR